MTLFTPSCVHFFILHLRLRPNSNYTTSESSKTPNCWNDSIFPVISRLFDIWCTNQIFGRQSPERWLTSKPHERNENTRNCSKLRFCLCSWFHQLLLIVLELLIDLLKLGEHLRCSTANVVILPLIYVLTLTSGHELCVVTERMRYKWPKEVSSIGSPSGRGWGAQTSGGAQIGTYAPSRGGKFGHLTKNRK